MNTPNMNIKILDLTPCSLIGTFLQIWEQKKYLLCKCKKWGYSSRKNLFMTFAYLIGTWQCFPTIFFDLSKSSKIPKIFHNLILFYRIISFWNNINKRVVHEYSEFLDLNKHFVCKHFWKFSCIDSPYLCWLSSWPNFSFFIGGGGGVGYLTEKAISSFQTSIW